METEKLYIITIRPKGNSIITKELEDKILDKLEESRNNPGYKKTDKGLQIWKFDCIWDEWDNFAWEIEDELNVFADLEIEGCDEYEDEDW